MKFYKYLNENILDVIDMDKIKKDCSLYFKNLKKGGYNFLYSGRKGITDIVTKKKIRKNRRPLDTPEILHDLLDRKFLMEFGVKARSESLFAKADKQVGFYGRPYYVFPIGNYNLIWSDKIDDLFTYLDVKVRDLYDASSARRFFNDIKDDPEEYRNEVLKEIENIIEKEIMPTYKESKVLQVHQGRLSEVMVVADSVWLMDCKSISEFELAEWVQKNA